MRICWDFAIRGTSTRSGGGYLGDLPGLHGGASRFPRLFGLAIESFVGSTSNDTRVDAGSEPGLDTIFATSGLT